MRSLKAMRRKLGLTQRSMGDLIGLSCPAICRMESGELNVSKTTRRILYVIDRAIDVGALKFSCGWQMSYRDFVEMVKRMSAREK